MIYTGKDQLMMKKLLMLLALLLCCLCLTALAEEVPMITYGTASFPADSVSIDMGDVKVKDYTAFCQFLDQFPALTHVDMFSTKIKKPQLEMLAERYPNVTWGWTITFDCCNKKHALRTDATAWSTLHNNQSTHHTSDDFSVLKYCPNLVALDLGHNGITDLSFLYDLPNLKVLILACCRITDITPLASLTQLEYLEIFKNRITDISPLTGLTNLIDLNICFNNISDWTPILGMSRLERLWMYNSNNYSNDKPVPKTVIAQLKEALPDCHIDSTHYSTTGGWREHRRYEIINTMFTTATYIPFSETEE